MLRLCPKEPSMDRRTLPNQCISTILDVLPFLERMPGSLTNRKVSKPNCEKKEVQL